VTETEPDVYEKPETPITEVYQRRFTSAVRASLGEGNPGTLPSAEKNEFGIGGDAISRCLEGLTLCCCFYRAMLSRERYCREKSSVRPSFRPSVSK